MNKINEDSTEEQDSDFWLAVSFDALKETWGDPAEDVWDEIYNKQTEKLITNNIKK